MSRNKADEATYEQGYAAAEKAIVAFLRNQAAAQEAVVAGRRPSRVRRIVAQQLAAAAEDVASGDYLEQPHEAH